MTTILTTQEIILVKETISQMYTKLNSGRKFINLTQILQTFCTEKKGVIEYERFITLNTNFIIKMYKENI